MQKRQIFLSIALSIAVCAGAHNTAFSQGVPGPADAGRIDPQARQPDFDDDTTNIPQIVTPEPSDRAVPENAASVKFTLKSIRLKGARAFSEDTYKSIYQSSIDQEIPLSKVWQFAEELTNLYREKGYFLSRAYVPAQEIENGEITIVVVEGFVGEVQFDDPQLSKTSYIRNLISNIKNSKPIASKKLEEILLRLNALHGYSFRALLEPLGYGREGETRLVLTAAPTAALTLLELNNYGSRFLGPYQSIATHQRSFAPGHVTTFSVLSSLPADELKYGSISHQYVFTPNWALEFAGSYVKANPGSNLAANDIDSRSKDISFGGIYHPIYQRQEDLKLFIKAFAKNTDSTVLGGNILMQEDIRGLRTGLSYNKQDRWNGYNFIDVQLTQGLDILSASKPGNLNLSRAEAEPDFTSVNMNYIRQQALGANYLLTGKLAAQWASQPLYSSEEFGYGGQAFGRAYDSSELTGDHGVAAAIELRYRNAHTIAETTLSPYVFYDIGKVWNEDTGGSDISAASAGLGVHAAHPSGVQASAGLAWPLTKDASAPIYGDGDNPRLIMQLGVNF